MAKPRGFNKLPTELRLDIYEYYFAAHEFEFNFLPKSRTQLAAQEPALLQVTKVIRREAFDTYARSLAPRIQAKYDRLDVLNRAIEATRCYEVWQAFQAVFEEKDALEREEMRIENLEKE